MIAIEKEVEGGLTTWFEDVILIHNAVSEVAMDEIDLHINFLGHRLEAPIIIAGMTGGHEIAAKINAILAEAAETRGLGIGVGSQRAAIENPSLRGTYSIVRKKAPTAFVIANIGASQLVLGYSKQELSEIIDMVRADALAIHLNLLQEVVQPEGQPCFKGIISRLRELREEVDIPLIAKETGSGISKEAALQLSKAHIDAIDIGGAGGTNWAIVEHYRAQEADDKRRERLSLILTNWGIPTAISICEVRAVLPRIPLIATGGIRTGLDIAKALALGADAVGIALPMLRAAYKDGLKGVLELIDQLIFELKAVMLLVGARRIEDLRKSPIVVSPRFSEWLRARGITLSKIRQGL